LKECRIIRFRQNEIIFNQGDSSPEIFFILKGTVALKVNKSDMGNLDVFIKIYYDGQEFGETNQVK
jgi:CRP-like cAMP-binding protein